VYCILGKGERVIPLREMISDPGTVLDIGRMEIGISESVYLATMVMVMIVRLCYTRDPVSRRVRGESILERILLILVALGMFILPVLSIFSDWFSPLDYNVPLELVPVGAGMNMISVILLWRAHSDLGPNWTPTLGLRRDQRLVREGVYSWVRHPMYTAHWLWAFAQPLLIHNLLGGWFTLLTFAPLYLTRVGREERMMMDRFGDEYVDYCRVTGRLLPRMGGK
jgi:protein-S-isoprenylcysteine O-methyltransferase Ste14